MRTNLQLFLFTVDEYKRFQNALPLQSNSALTDEYSETDYIGIQVRLMLLRKYFTGGKILENVNIKKVIAEAQDNFPSSFGIFETILDDFKKIEHQQIEHLLSDGTKLSLYETIEDTVYGLYLHADENRINHLRNTTELIRFVCIRMYVVDVEKVVLRLYSALKECGVTSEINSNSTRAPLIYLGDTNSNNQSITGSPHWSNMYGRDATEEDLQSIVDNLSLEEKKMLLLCMSFTEMLKSSPLQIKKLKKHIHPAARRDWGDFTNAQSFYLSIPNPGISTKVRYNQNKDTAYVRLLPHVNDGIHLNSPHIISETYEFALGKWFGRWMIYSFGGHLDSIYETKKK